jgi:DNA-binding PadR family transcriptional regulator
MIQVQPRWGYKIKKEMEKNFQIKLRHGALYSTLNLLEQKGFLTSQKQTIKGRMRRVYTITEDGKEYLQSYYSILKEHLEDRDRA